MAPKKAGEPKKPATAAEEQQEDLVVLGPKPTKAEEGPTDAPAAASSGDPAPTAGPEKVDLANWPPKETPWCSCCLLTLCIIAHLLVLYGNLQVAGAITAVGDSVKGWTSVGVGVGNSFEYELSPKLINTTDQLDRAVAGSQLIAEAMDQALIELADVVDAQTGQSFNGTMEAVAEQAAKSIDKESAIMEPTVKIIGSALQPVGELIGRLDPKALNSLAMAGKSIKMGQEMASDALVKIGWKQSVGRGEEEVLKKSFTMYDADGDGSVSLEEVKDAAERYKIVALQSESRTKAQFDKSAKGGKLDEAGFKTFMSDVDPTGLQVKNVALRNYAQKLASLAEALKLTVFRTDTAHAILDVLRATAWASKDKLNEYSAKLMSKESAVPSTAIANILAWSCTDPTDGGKKSVIALSKANSEATKAGADMASNTTFWSQEGFTPADQPSCMEKVTKWQTAPALSAASLLTMGRRMGTGRDSAAHMELVVSLAGRLAQESVLLHELDRIDTDAKSNWDGEKSHMLKVLLHELQNGEFMSKAPGQKVVLTITEPEVRTFAQWLAVQARKDSDYTIELIDRFEGQTTFDTMANTAVEMTSKMKAFANMAVMFAGEEDEEGSFEHRTNNFMEKGMKEAVAVIGKELAKAATKQTPGSPSLIETGEGAAQAPGGNGSAQEPALPEADKKALFDSLEAAKTAALNSPSAAESAKSVKDKELKERAAKEEEKAAQDAKKEAAKAAKKEASPDGKAAAAKEAALARGASPADAEKAAAVAKIQAANETAPEGPAEPTKTWASLARIVRAMIQVGPGAIETLRQVQVPVDVTSKDMTKDLAKTRDELPPVFHDIASVVKMVAYLLFMLFLPLYLGFVYYAYWAGGYMGGPSPRDDGEQPVEGRCECLKRCWRCCCNCCIGYHDTQTCMFSVVIVMQIICLVLYVLGIVFVLLAVVYFIVPALCAPLPVINGGDGCTNVMKSLKNMLSTFQVSHPDEDVYSICSVHSLHTCSLIEPMLSNAAIYCVAGSWMAVVLTFELIIQFAQMHEGARYRRMAKVFATKGAEMLAQEDH
jgi:hypothetical protein